MSLFVIYEVLCNALHNWCDVFSVSVGDTNLAKDATNMR